MTLLIFIAASAFFVILYIIITYNGLIHKKNSVEYAFSSTDVMLKKRSDLIPNLVESVKQYMTHEKDLLTKITELRSQVMQSDELSDAERFSIENKLSQALSSLKVAVENYPDLKANQNILQLQAALNEAEEQISAARRAYNAAVLSFNNGIEMFPSSIIAGMMKYQRKASFEIEDAERANVNLGQLFKS